MSKFLSRSHHFHKRLLIRVKHFPCKRKRIKTKVIKSQANQRAYPIYLPALSTSPESVKTVGGAEDVILKLPGLQGFQIKVKANSVTFPDGSRQGTLIISPVTADRLPMSPPAGGAQFGIPAWTIQPAGTRFDPPIEVTLPNTRAYPAGDNIPIVQWDHDLAQYVPMGRATVSEDGAVLITDSGSGLTKAGWGGACVYDPDKCGKKETPKCDKCEKLDDPSGDCPSGKCVADASKDGFTTVSDNGKLVFSLDKLQALKSLTGLLGINANWGGEISANWSLDKNCCSTDSSGRANNVKFQVSGQIEFALNFPWSPIIDKVKYLPYTKYIYYILPQSKVKGSIAGNGGGERDFCKNEGQPFGSLQATFEFDAISVGGNSLIVGNTPANNKAVELFVFDLGAAASSEYKFTALQQGVLQGDYEFKVVAFIKGQVNTPSLNFTFADLQLVLAQDKYPLQIPLPFLNK